jgi:hypothetical protein
MLPLWIIDITSQSNRQGAFKHLVGQIDHVYLSETLFPKKSGSIIPCPDVTLSSDDEGVDDTPVLDEQGETPLLASEVENEFIPDASAEVSNVLTTKEEIEEEERRAAQKNAIIRGDYWYYTNVCNYFEGTDKNDAEAVAHCLYDFQSDLIREGQDFIQKIRRSNVKPFQTINIVVLGDVTEEFTRIVFPSVAAILQKEKGRILPHHIHQGMEIMGMLFVPCDINAKDVRERQAIQRTLTEIQVQHDVTSIRGYDRMLIYQDVQNRTECTYSVLNEQEQAEYMLQCLVHLYLACDKTHPLISGTASADSFYLSMGAASVYYDMSIEDEKERIRIENDIIRYFKEKGDAEVPSAGLAMINSEEYAPYTYFQKFTPDLIDLEDVEPNDPSPWHPIRNFFEKHLKRYYYNLYLRFFPADFYHKIVAQVEEKTRATLDKIAADSKKKYKDAEARMPFLLQNLLTNIKANDGGLPFIVSSLKDMQAKLSNNRKEIRPYLNREFWPYIEKRMMETPLEDPFIDYHDVYLQDLQAKNEGAGCLAMKEESKNQLKKLLSHETTMLSTIAQCVLGGIIFIFAFLPILDRLSPDSINLGDVHKYSLFWSIGLFCIPILIYLIKYWLYNRKKVRIIEVLKAYYLHDAYARIANRIDSEINTFYDKMIALCEAYLGRCQAIRKEVLPSSDKIIPNDEIPRTKFNQPLTGGSFGDGELLPPEKNDDSEVKVNYIRRKANSLQKSDYYLLINQFHNDFEFLFKGIYLTENFTIRIKEETGEEELVTKAQQEQEIAEEWEKNKSAFHRNLTESVKSIMIPRPNPTVGDKTLVYSRNMRRTDILEPLIVFAACNGEVTSTADTEFADIKANRDEIQELTNLFLPVANTKYQIEKYDAFYKKYIFVTRWRSFDHFSYNRILPTEDFDEHIRSVRVYEDQSEKDVQQEKAINISSISLWALCPDDTSSEWFRLIDAQDFKEAFEMRETYRKILNQND